MAAVRAGVGRETAHEAIKEHAVAVAIDMRERGADRNDLFDRIAADPRLPLDRTALADLLADRLSFTGMAGAQVADVADRVAKVLERFGDAAGYLPAPVL
jgi:adenylosuccinate lyase